MGSRPQNHLPLSQLHGRPASNGAASGAGPQASDTRQQSSGGAGSGGEGGSQLQVGKERMRWTPELHAAFVRAVNLLGGPTRAKPKEILDLLRIPGLSLNHVKSHLQKYRMSEGSSDDMVALQQLQLLASQKRPRLEGAGLPAWGPDAARRGPAAAAGRGGQVPFVQSLAQPLAAQQPLAIPPLQPGPAAGPGTTTALAALLAAAQPAAPSGPAAGGAGYGGWGQWPLRTVSSHASGGPTEGVGVGRDTWLPFNALAGASSSPPGALQLAQPGAAAAAGGQAARGGGGAVGQPGAALGPVQTQLMELLSTLVGAQQPPGARPQLPAAAPAAAGSPEGGPPAAAEVLAATSVLAAAAEEGAASLEELQQGVAVLHKVVATQLESAAALQLDLQRKLQLHIQAEREFEQQLSSHVNAIRDVHAHTLGPLLAQLTSLSELCANVAGSRGARLLSGSGTTEDMKEGAQQEASTSTAAAAAGPTAAQERGQAQQAQQVQQHEGPQQAAPAAQCSPRVLAAVAAVEGQQPHGQGASPAPPAPAAQVAGPAPGPPQAEQQPGVEALAEEPAASPPAQVVAHGEPTEHQPPLGRADQGQ